MRQVKYYPRGRESRNASELSKEISKKPFFFKIIYNPVHTLYIIEMNRYSEWTKSSEFAIKNISSAFLSFYHGLVKRFRVKFTEKLIYLTPRMPLPSDFYGYSFNEVMEKGSYFREPGLYEVDKHFEEAG
jgi:hypothetical protein